MRRVVNVTGCEMVFDPDGAILDRLEEATRDLEPGTYRIEQLPRTGDNIRFVIHG